MVWPWTKIKSPQVVIGIYHHTKFENDILLTVDTRLLTNSQMGKENEQLHLFKHSCPCLVKVFSRVVFLMTKAGSFFSFLYKHLNSVTYPCTGFHWLCTKLVPCSVHFRVKLFSIPVNWQQRSYSICSKSSSVCKCGFCSFLDGQKPF